MTLSEKYKEQLQDFDMPGISSVCSLCVHLNLNAFPARRCSAFPKGIPDEIWLGKNDHTKPYPGDNGIQFIKIEK